VSETTSSFGDENLEIFSRIEMRLRSKSRKFSGIEKNARRIYIKYSRIAKRTYFRENNTHTKS
jgi:hypothetical protein